MMVAENHIQRNETGPTTYTTHKINSELIKGLNTKPTTIKLLQENVGGNLLDIGLGNGFLNLIPKPKATRAKRNK